MRHPPLTVLLGLAAFVAVVGSIGFALSGCGSREGASPGSSPQQTSPPASPQQTSAPSGPTEWPTEGSSPARLSGDGRYFGYIRGASAEPPTIRFDVAQFFYGRTVQKAAEEDGAVRPGEPVSNDHYERNRVKEIRVLELATDLQVNAGPPASFLMWHVSSEVRKKCFARPEAAPCTLSVSAFFAAFKKRDDEYWVPVWVTTRDDLVVAIDEQYFP